MVNQVLTKDMGPTTHKCFNDDAEQEDAEGDPANDEDENPEGKQASTDILDTFKHQYVKEVVRNPAMWFKRVPRLGSFMAVPMVYRSCLFYDALEKAIADYQEIAQKRAEQQKEIEAWEEEQQRRRDEAGTDPFEEEPRPDWEEIEDLPFESFDEKWVVCLDTMGQDREFSPDEKRFCLTVVQAFIKNWERAEVASLKADRDARVEVMSRDPTIEQEATQTTLEQIDKTVDELVAADGREYEDDE